LVLPSNSDISATKKELADTFRQLRSQFSQIIVDEKIGNAAMERIEEAKNQLAIKSKSTSITPTLSLGFKPSDADKLTEFHQQRRQLACKDKWVAARMCAMHLDKKSRWRDELFNEQVLNNPQCSINQPGGEVAKDVCLGVNSG
jgi:hypothetical protein